MGRQGGDADAIFEPPRLQGVATIKRRLLVIALSYFVELALSYLAFLLNYKVYHLNSSH